ncbi:MAG TPA: metallophosphoesterase family protein [Candidatus Nitrosotalea sp.]|nr:metallophosphoesterase family protein [Candidatus Nitrosotalea sp.]
MSAIEQDKKKFTDIINSTIITLCDERLSGQITGGRVIGSLIQLEIPENLVIVGDLHGDIKSLKRILEEIGFENFLSNFNNKIIFLGDYIDRGSHSLEVLQYICYLKCKYRDSIILMRGNHEAPIEFSFSSHDLPLKIQEQFGQNWTHAYKKVLELFRLFNLVTLINDKLFLVHGGPPVKFHNYKESISTASLDYENNSVLEELLWNDPRPLKYGTPFEKSRRSFGKHFGDEVSKKCLETTNTCAIVRSHEPCQRYRLDHNNMVITIFSCGESYPNFVPSYLFLTGKQLNTIQNASDLIQHIREIKK